MVNLTIDKIAVSVSEGTTILEAAASVGIEIPSLCYLKDINEISACRVCCVEVEAHITTFLSMLRILLEIWLKS